MNLINFLKGSRLSELNVLSANLEHYTVTALYFEYVIYTSKKWINFFHDFVIDNFLYSKLLLQTPIKFSFSALFG